MDQLTQKSQDLCFERPLYSHGSRHYIGALSNSQCMVQSKINVLRCKKVQEFWPRAFKTTKLLTDALGQGGSCYCL